ncbi:aminoglycoside phosphotransferase family protein [Fibrobacterota bacterium]
MDYSDISPAIAEYLLSKNLDSNCSLSLAGSAGSQRLYFRLQQNMVSFILLVAPEDDSDFGRFLRLTQFYRLLGLPVPMVYCIDDKDQQVLLEDLGNNRLYDAVRSHPEETQLWYKKAIDVLVFLQTRCFQRQQECPDILSRTFDRRDLLWETGYFKREYLESYRKKILSDKENRGLSSEFLKLAKAVEMQPKTVMHRDFQSQNIMEQDRRLRIIDYQGSRLGTMYYDPASLLLDPYVMISDRDISELLMYYHSKSLSQLPLEEASRQFFLAGAQRIMQALAAYCFLSETKGLAEFKQYIPAGEKRLKWVLEQAGLDEIGKIV